ncbi:MAG TPA: methyltransferase domain-containing protein [Candidatus Binataceae bacterium]|nr:methyltransferase domain-containing protein [Candidatus Binataceae bacterium]
MATNRQTSPSRRTGVRGAVAPRTPVRRPRLRLTATSYIVHTQPGLEGIALAEVEARFAAIAAKRSSSSEPRPTAPVPSVHEIARRVIPGRAGMCLLEVSEAEPLCLLRSTEDIFAAVAYQSGITEERLALDHVRRTAREAPYVETALASRVKTLPGSRAGRRLKFRVIARVVGDHAFKRVEFQRAVERGIEERGDRAWRLVEDEADVEFWASLIEDEFFLAIRLSDETMRLREYKAAHIPGSLRPSVAAAMGILSRPQSDDVVLDPFCGAGTILIERAHLERYQSLVGGDLDRGALEAARTNIGPRYKPIEVHSWDAAALPLPDRAVNRIITNLPWGSKHGSHADNRRLYPRLFKEFARLIQPGGVVVMLTGETRLMGDLLRTGPLRAERIFRVSILGAPAAIYVCPQR